MQQQSLQTCEQCINLLSEPPETFKRVQFLKKLAKISNNQKYRKSSLFLYCFYCILHKYDYVEALQAIEKSQGVDEGSMLSIAVAKLIRVLLYTHIDKHRDSLTFLRQAYALIRSSADSISLEIKNHYKRMVPLVVSNMNTSNGRKSFYKFFNQVYDELAKESSNNQLNEEILYSIHAQIQFLKTQIDVLPILAASKPKNQPQNTLQKSLSGTKLNTKANSFHHQQAQQDDYMGSSKPLTKEQKSVNNIKKMIESKQKMKQSLQQSKYSQFGHTGLSKKNATVNMLKNQPNPYQLNLYVEEKPHCEFL